MTDDRAEAAAREQPVARSSRLLLCAGAAALILVVIVPVRICQQRYLNHVSGAWAALADDVAHGVLYRPLVSDLGYGGTRYFPLHFVLHGLLVALGVPLLPAGHLLSVFSAAGLASAGALGLRRYGASRSIALAGGILTLASRTAVMGAAGIRGDILPLALGVLGLALVPRRTKERVLLPALVLGLAVLAKPTLVWAGGGAVLSLAVSGRTQAALRLALAATAVFALGMLGAESWSDGAMLASFRSVWSGGGFSWRALRDHLQYLRPGDLAWILGGLALTVSRRRAAIALPFCAAGLVCAPVTLLLLSGEGIHVNQLIDPTSIGALAVISALADASRARVAEAVALVATTLAMAEAALLDSKVGRRGEMEQTAAAIAAGPDPILSEQPWIPLLAGERPFLIDAFSLRQTRQTTPAVERDFLDRLDHCRFRAVVLLGTIERSDTWYDQGQFGPGFRDHMRRAYALAAIVGAHAIYLPACDTRPTLLAEGARRSAEDETINDRAARSGLIATILSKVKMGLR